ncbi:type A chloramphenicol O-acetyltransferase [Glaciibacter superstes]|uniref:type A chloramphenicol O-acetyltransferase n=1 Tax=Glaciibacter superstes TaxID=501023 RepID=UPI0003B41282|nr:type A chloramphenicol O-acetyltransferase [Glaciibacter superstes]
MTEKRPIDMSTWARRETFEHYRGRVPCTYSATVELDVTEFLAAVKATGRKVYPAQVWAIATVVNRHEEFRVSVDEEGNPSVWDVVHPSFTVFNPERETFATVWAAYDPSFPLFHDQAVELLATHRTSVNMFPQSDTPENVFDISSIPWMRFTGFDLHIKPGYDHYLPIFTLGQFTERDGRTTMPFAVQIHHAAADGFHTARLVNELQEVFASASEWVS